MGTVSGVKEKGKGQLARATHDLFWKKALAPTVAAAAAVRDAVGARAVPGETDHKWPVVLAILRDKIKRTRENEQMNKLTP